MRAWPELLTIIIPLIIVIRGAACCGLVWGECGARAAPGALRCCGWVLGCRRGVPRVTVLRVDGVRVVRVEPARLLESYMPLASHRDRAAARYSASSVRYLCT